jgi:hypothetical protein
LRLRDTSCVRTPGVPGGAPAPAAQAADPSSAWARSTTSVTAPSVSSTRPSIRTIEARMTSANAR